VGHEEVHQGGTSHWRLRRVSWWNDDPTAAARLFSAYVANLASSFVV
jgi:hypothetical protein